MEPHVSSSIEKKKEGKMDRMDSFLFPLEKKWQKVPLFLKEKAPLHFAFSIDIKDLYLRQDRVVGV